MEFARKAYGIGKPDSFHKKSFIKSMNSSLLVKFALISVPFPSKWFSIILYLWSHFQILSHMLNTALLSFDSNTELQNSLRMFHRIFSMGDWSALDQISVFTFTVLIGTVSFLFAELCCVIYLFISLWKDIPLLLFVRKFLSAVMHVHVHILFYPIHVFGVNILSLVWGNDTNASNIRISNIAIQCLTLVCLVLNFIFATGRIAFLTPKIETKDTFSAHTRIIDFADLLMKAIAPIIWKVRIDSQFLLTLLLAIDLVYSLLRDWILFWFLPYYKILALRIATRAHLTVTLSAFSGLMPKIITNRKLNDKIEFGGVLFLLLMLICFNLYSKYLQKILTNLLFEPQARRPSHLLHYWKVFKHFSSNARPSRPKANTICDQNLFYYAALNHYTSIQDLLKDIGMSKIWDPEVAGNIDKNFFYLSLDLLKNSIQRTNDNLLLKLSLARYYAKYESFYVLADQIVTQGLKHSSSFGITLSFHLVRLQLFNKINAKTRNLSTAIQDSTESAVKLSIRKYMEMNETFEYMKTDIVKQLTTQKKFWTEFQTPDPDCFFLTKLSLENYERAKHLKNGWFSYKQFIDLTFPQPLLIYGLYLTFILNDLTTGEHLLQQYYDLEFRRKQEASMQANNSQINIQNLSETIRFTVSGLPGSIGKILDCSNNLEAFLGFQKRLILDKSINSLLPSLFSDKQNSLDNHSLKMTEPELLNTTIETFVVNKQGYIVACWVYVTLKFLPSHGLCYYILVSPITDEKRLVLAKETGKIINFSHNFASDFEMGANETSNLNLFSLCPELGDITDAFTLATMKSPPKKLVTSKTFQNINSFLNPSSQLSLQAGESSMKTLDKKTDTDKNLFQELYDKFTKGDTLAFCYPPMKAYRNSSNRKKERIVVVYHVKVEASVNHGRMVLKLALSKIRSMKGASDSNAWNALLGINSQDAYSSFRFDDIRIHSSEPNSPFTPFTPHVLTPQDKKKKERPKTPITKYLKKSTFRKHQVLTEERSEQDDDILLSEQLETVTSNRLLSHPRKEKQTIPSIHYETPTSRLLNVLTTEGNDPPLLTSKTTRRVQSKLLTLTREDSSPPKNKEVKSLTSGILFQKKRNVNPSVIRQGRGDQNDIITESSAEDPINIASPKVNQQEEENLSMKSEHNTKEQFNVPKEKVADELIKKDRQNFNKIKTLKKFQDILENRRYNKASVYFVGLFLLTIIFQIVFLVWLNFNVLNASRQAANSSQVLQAAYFRTYWINLSNQETRFWVAVRARMLHWPIEQEIDTTNITFTSVNHYNQELRRSIVNLKPELQSLFFAKEVDIFVRDSDNKLTLSSVDDSFQAVDKIVYNGFKNVYKPPTIPPQSVNFIDPESRFIFDNSFDDLLITSEKLIQAVENYLFETLENAHTNMTIFLSITLSVLALFMIWSAKVIKNINNEFQRFLNLFFLLPNDEAKKTEVIISTLHDMLNNNQEEKNNSLLTDESSPIKVLLDVKNSFSSNPATNSSKIVRKFPSKTSLAKYRRINWFILLHLYSTLVIIIGIMAVYYIKALNQIIAIKTEETAINSALENMNLQSLMSTEIQSLAMENGNTTVRHQPVLEDLKKNLKRLASISEIEEGLRNQGVLSARQEQIFFNLSCTEAYSSEYILPADGTQEECYNIAKGLGYIGLVNIIPHITARFTEIIQKFEESTGTSQVFQDLYEPDDQEYIDLSMIFFLLSFDSALQEFQGLMSNLERERVLFGWLAVSISLVLITIIWIFILRKMEQQRCLVYDVLNIVPTKIFLKNPPLKKYVQDLPKR